MSLFIREVRIQKLIYDHDRQPSTHGSSAQRNHIGVVVFSGHLRAVNIGKHSATNARYLIGRNTNTDSCTANHDATIGLLIFHSLCYRKPNIRIIYRSSAVGSIIMIGISFFLKIFDDLIELRGENP